MITNHTAFFLTDQTGVTHDIDAANVGPSIGTGHLVSAAWLVHNGKPGTAFLVYNHTTGSVYVEATGKELFAARGLVRMVFKLPLANAVILALAIVPIPILVVVGLGARAQLRLFRRFGVRPLVAHLERCAAGMPPAQVAAIVTPNATDHLASQMRQITDLHESGALSPEEFKAAKTKLLAT
ncbi:MAG: SHOCT domain-containing protein [Acidimicrobiales bacterium]